MKKINLESLFEKVSYDWEKDKKHMEHICSLTKTRVNPNLIGQSSLVFGSEQTFLLKALAESIHAKNFFEIGTGRGTACYAISLISSIEEIHTVDIIPHNEKQTQAINFEKAIVSNHDLFNLINFDSKEKISFHHRNDMNKLLDLYDNNFFDISFIDGNHSIESIIKEDFIICNTITRDGGLIIFDDYHPKKYKVKKVVDNLIDTFPDFRFTFINFHGHLFDLENKVEDHGIVVVEK